MPEKFNCPDETCTCGMQRVPVYSDVTCGGDGLCAGMFCPRCGSFVQIDYNLRPLLWNRLNDDSMENVENFMRCHDYEAEIYDVIIRRVPPPTMQQHILPPVITLVS